ncbi:hypothetical protein ACH33_07680 [Aneurinibacillus sp. XH2]|uniref:hypothetical protein n=1 Tax=Aneurinibacillus sp. XH2 TaxID=1450761 RepID=UPI000710400D|nr:hypothetical protein [Aneurinibacillus sp. XH2]AMA72743.1 hypothetical protein ACH33_07680 [Aneurinibacillus sp. XH2]
MEAIEQRLAELEARVEKLEKRGVTTQKEATPDEIKVVSELIKVCSAYGLTYEQAQNVACYLRQALNVMANKNRITT